MASLLSDSVVLDEVGKSLTFLVEQGESFPGTLFFHRDGVAEDIRSWQFDVAQAQLFSGVLGSNGIPQRIVPMAGDIGTLTLQPSVRSGVIYLMVPTDLYTAPIPPNATTNVPVIVAMVRGKRPDGRVEIIRVQIVVKYGIENAA